MKQQLFYNTQLLPADQPILKISNRGFLYGDCIFETIAVFKKRPVFLKDHLQRMRKGMQVVKMPWPRQFTEKFFRKQIEDLLKANDIPSNARVRITVFREGGLKDKKPDIHHTLTAESLSYSQFTLNKKGLTIGAYQACKKPVCIMSNFKTGNYLVPLLAVNKYLNNAWDDCLIYNDRQQVIEATTSNLFLRAGKILLTPSLDTGCVDGILRKQVLEIAKTLKMQVQSLPLTHFHFREADECWLTNSIRGLQWVKKFDRFTFSADYAGDFVKKLNARWLTNDEPL